MELTIERDVSAEQAFAAQIGSASSHLVEAFGITEEIAHRLTEGGLGDLANYAQADADDLTDILGGDRELAERIYAKAQRLGQGD